MDSNFDSLKRLFDTLKGVGLLERLFGWGKIKSQLIDASADLQRLISANENLKQENTRLERQMIATQATLNGLQDSYQRLNTEAQVAKENNNTIVKQNEERLKELTTLTEANKNYLRRGQELSNELAVTRQKLETAETEVQRARTQITQLNKDEEFKKQDHAKAVASLMQIQDKLQRDREMEIHNRNQAEIDRIKKLKETWSNHETNVQNRIKIICTKHGVEYVDKVPFKGSPDNTLKINDEFIIFDAKSPANDDLSNFPSYIKNQTESVKKYVNEEGVRREVFLVIPTNTLDRIEQFEYRLADYSVYIISHDALEPIILALRRIEDYAFAEQLSPEERENICRVIGKFIHLSKRRIQIDGFFAKQFFELVYRSEAELPKDILDIVVEFEKSEKLNPPIEKRAKQISLKELEQDNNRLKNEANQKGILTEESLLSREINKIALYSTDIEDSKNRDQTDLFSR
ncbi:MAG: hypothetical protein DI538_25305 [Azospira oryzae]|jgi:hypothetical protein|nr:MAG: hypothetical protein DI538_25305 [Azospira oryzae]